MNTIAIKESYNLFLLKIEKYLPFLTVAFFLFGIGLAGLSETFALTITGLMNGVINSYSYIAPIAIYLILTPSLLKIISTTKRRGKNFAKEALLWFASLRFWALVFGAVFTAIVFGLPIYINSTVTFLESTMETLKTLFRMLFVSLYFYALYASVLSVFILSKFKKQAKLFEKSSDWIEIFGKHLVPLVPLFMLVIGSYVAYLPSNINNQITVNLAEGAVMPHINTLHILGFEIFAGTPKGMIFVYLVGALLTGIACMIWHFFLLLITKYKIRSFSVRDYFKKYWIKVYPLLWSTSSEALATPLNLHLIKRNYPEIRTEVRQFGVGVGSFININGTMICTFILAGLVAGILGIQISLIQLLLAIPLVFLLGYGVPGIPGELLLFAGPITALLAIEPEVIPIFLALYLGLQVGLPDSFRTGANSTDNCLCSLLLERKYECRLNKNILLKERGSYDLQAWEKVHSLPGRIRLYNPLLYEGNGYHTSVKKVLSSTKGVVQHVINPITGSILVNYNTTEIDENQLLATLKVINLNLNKVEKINPARVR